MTLGDMLVPNKFGTMPMVWIPGIGMINRYTDHIAKWTKSNGATELLDLDMPIKMSANGVHVHMSDIRHRGLVALKMYMQPLTAETMLIHQAIQPIKEVYLAGDGLFLTGDYSNLIEQDLKLNVDGTGWYMSYNETVPVVTYVEDILYRLDLQGKLP